jgi:hypothetical protein
VTATIRETGGIGDWPIYPGVFAASWVIGILAASTASVHALPRPLALAVIIVVLVQLLLSALTRDRHVGALLAFILGMSIGGPPSLALVGGLLVVVVLLIAILILRRGRRIASIPWRIVTRPLNVIAALTLVITVLNAAIAGALTPSELGVSKTRSAAGQPLPDIYVVLLDGHPRWDTMANVFGLDPEPFLADMASLGFDVARHSHSNYDVTALTLASMFGMRQVADLPQVADPPNSPAGQYRALSRAINQGPAFDALRAQGFEVISIASDFSDVATYNADRLLDSGQLTEFEYSVLQAGSLKTLFPESQSAFLMGQHRDRIEASFASLVDLASAPADHPRFVFAHILAPHPPIAYGPDGEPRTGWPCIPAACSIFYGGEAYGDERAVPIRDQVAYIDKVVAATARKVLAASHAPPVIIFMSDHGIRWDPADRAEMLRSFFVANTPGRPDLFPDDVSPVNLIPRLLNAYADAGLPFASEESYWERPDRVHVYGPLSYTPFPGVDLEE